MIIIKLIGGLGNQMFQYAAGRRLAHKLGVTLKLDITGFENYKLRRYSLSNFNIQENIASLDEINSLKKPTFSEQLITKLLRRQPRPVLTYIRQKHFHFDPYILNLSDNVYMEGYWQSEKYFADIAEIICRDFAVKPPQIGKNKELAELISSTNSVCLHIRRGDYVTNLKAYYVHGICGMDYYLRCVNFIADKIKKPHFFVFGDDPKWARENLDIPFPLTFIEHNGPDKDCEDMRLMSQCRFNIIANSTFSWWGAWLNPYREKIVCAPKQWFSQKEQVSRKINDLFPHNWIIL